jgi:hypothetical protein
MFVTFNRIRPAHFRAVSSPPPSHSIGWPGFFDPKPDRPAWLLGSGHELPDGIEDTLELGIVSLLQFVKPSCQVAIRGDHLAEADKSSHDFDVHERCARTAEHADSMATPCSLKALGSVRVPPHLDLPNWNLKSLNSASVNGEGIMRESYIRDRVSTKRNADPPKRTGAVCSPRNLRSKNIDH